MFFHVSSTFRLEALIKEYVEEMQGNVRLHSACVCGVLRGVEPTDFVDLPCSLLIS